MFERKVTVAFILFISLNLFASAQDNRGVANVINTNQKVALVIGNAGYAAGIGKLKNPINDAADVAAALKRLGFNLVGGKAHFDLNRREMRRLIGEFGAQIKKGGVGVFYFAGHGVQIDRRNYLIPITDSLQYQEDAEFEAVDVDTVLREMEYAENALNILILDACRNNNLPKKTRNTRDGLVEPQRKPSGVFIAFAARDGQTASENSANRNGLYTQELLKNLEMPNLRLEDIFIKTRREVKRLSNRAQEPIEYGSLDDIFYFKTDGQTQLPTLNSNIQNQAVSNPNLGIAALINPGLQGEATFNYKINSKYAIGTGVYKITTSWSERSSDCVWAYSYHNDGIANSKLKSFDSISDVTRFDMSLSAREICLNQVAIFKNKLNYYTMVQVLKVSRSENLLSIRYKILPNRLQPNWKNNYFSNANAGRVTFDFSNNKGKFVIGENDFTFVTKWSKCSSDCIYLYDYPSNIKQVVLATDSTPIKNSKDASRYPKVESGIEIKRGQRAVLKNSKGKYAVITIIDIKAEGFYSIEKKVSSDTDEVVFEYEILPD